MTLWAGFTKIPWYPASPGPSAPLNLFPYPWSTLSPISLGSCFSFLLTFSPVPMTMFIFFTGNTGCNHRLVVLAAPTCVTAQTPCRKALLWALALAQGNAFFSPRLLCFGLTYIYSSSKTWLKHGIIFSEAFFN